MESIRRSSNRVQAHGDLNGNPPSTAARVAVAFFLARSLCFVFRYVQRFFYHYDAAPLLIVNADHLNPIERDEDFNLLVTRIKNMRGKREFFNLGE